MNKINNKIDFTDCYKFIEKTPEYKKWLSNLKEKSSIGKTYEQLTQFLNKTVKVDCFTYDGYELSVTGKMVFLSEHNIIIRSGKNGRHATVIKLKGIDKISIIKFINKLGENKWQLQI